MNGSLRLSRTFLFAAMVQLLPEHSTGQTCTSGFLNPLAMNEHIQSQRLVPLLGRHVAPYTYEQWIFPSLRFTCRGMLSKWIFKGEGSLESACRVHITTWRYIGIEQTYFSLVYEQISTTNGNTAGVSMMNGSIFSYELARPVLVQPGDIVGVESASRICANFYVFNNILSLNVSGNSSTSSVSYMRSGTRRTTFPMESPDVYHKQDYLPLIYAVMEAPNEPATVTLRTPFTDPGDEEERSSIVRTLPSIREANTTDSERFSSRIIIIAGTSGGGTIALLVVVTVCITAIWASGKSRKTNISRRRQYGSQVGQNGSINLCGTLLQENAAYNGGQIPSLNTTPEQDMWLEQSYVSWAESYEDINLENEDYEIMSDNMMYGNREGVNSNYSYPETLMHKNSAYRQTSECNNTSTLMVKAASDEQATMLTGTHALEDEACGLRDSRSETYDKIERRSEVYETVDYKGTLPMHMSKNMAYAHSINTTTEPPVVYNDHDLHIQQQKRYCHNDEHQYEHIQ